MTPFEIEMRLTPQMADSRGDARLSGLLHLCQEAAGGHCKELGLDWDSLQKKGLFWALIRTRLEILRLPKAGEPIKMMTWPMPTTRSAFPRAAEAYDEEGNLLFRAVSLWVLMDVKKRTMVLPGRSGIDLEGLNLGRELEIPGSIGPEQTPITQNYQVQAADIDRNGHVNNTRYPDWLEAVSSLELPPVKGLTACYLSEALPGQALTLCRSEMGNTLSFQVLRPRENEAEKPERIFACRLEF